jgi:ribosome-associated protein
VNRTPPSAGSPVTLGPHLPARTEPRPWRGSWFLETPSMAPIDFPLRGEYIPLDALLKATGLVESGGAARMRITAGEVRVDGVVELRKTRKLRAGAQVVFGDRTVLVRVDPDAMPGNPNAPTAL